MPLHIVESHRRLQHEDLVSEVMTLDDEVIADHKNGPLPKNKNEVICLNDSEDDDDDEKGTPSSKKILQRRFFKED